MFHLVHRYGSFKHFHTLPVNVLLLLTHARVRGPAIVFSTPEAGRQTGIADARRAGNVRIVTRR